MRLNWPEIAQQYGGKDSGSVSLRFSLPFRLEGLRKMHFPICVLPDVPQFPGSRAAKGWYCGGNRGFSQDAPCFACIAARSRRDAEPLAPGARRARPGPARAMAEPATSARAGALHGTPSDPRPPKRRRVTAIEAMELVEVPASAPEPAVEPDAPGNVEAEAEVDIDLEAILAELEDPDEPLNSADRKRAHNKYVYWWQRKTGYRRATFKRQSAMTKYWCLKDLDYAQRKDRLTKFVRAYPDLAEIAARLLSAGRSRGEEGIHRMRSAVWTWQGDWGLLSASHPPGELSNGQRFQERALRLSVYKQEQEGGSRPSALPDPDARRRGKSRRPGPLADFSLRKGRPKELQARDGTRRGRIRAPARSVVGSRGLGQNFSGGVPALFPGLEPRALRAERGGGDEVACPCVCGRLRRQANEVKVDDTLFRGGAPFHSGDSTRLLRSGRNHFAGMYYLLMPKVTTLMAAGSHEPHKDFLVTGTWILGHLESGKITIADATAELRKVPNGITRNLLWVTEYAKARQEEAMERYLEYRAANSSEVKKPWRRYPLIEAWVSQYGSVRDRYHFLVLDGPSQRGKTAYCRALVPKGQVFEMTCSGNVPLNFEGYCEMTHELLLFDEACPAQVIANKNISGPVGPNRHQPKRHQLSRAARVRGRQEARHLHKQLETGVVEDERNGRGMVERELVPSACQEADVGGRCRTVPPPVPTLRGARLAAGVGEPSVLPAASRKQEAQAERFAGLFSRPVVGLLFPPIP